MLDATALLNKYRGKGVFVDSNLLVLLLVGRLNADRIQKFKRTRDFTIEDFKILEELIHWFGEPIIATAHVLSQVSDLTDLSGGEKRSINSLFQALVTKVREDQIAAKDLIESVFFSGFGLADASIAEVCKRDILVMTADVKLQIALGASGLDALNFNHVRALRWKR